MVQGFSQCGYDVIHILKGYTFYEDDAYSASLNAGLFSGDCQ